MRLLFDHNLSVRLIARLADLFPGASHIALVNLERASDEQVWEDIESGTLELLT